jgi:hypothetical protein
MDKNLQDYVYCRVQLKLRERKAGLKPKAPGELVQDYYRPEFDNCPLAQEYRQLFRIFGSLKATDTSDDETPSQPELVRRPKGGNDGRL